MNGGGRWVSLGEASKIYGVTVHTVRRWCDTGSVETKRTPGNQRMVYISSENRVVTPEKTKTDYIYVRVSSAKQRDDMERQSAFLQSRFPGFTVVKDIGSGLNYKRKGLLRLLAESAQGRVGVVAVFSKDRLCRFGFELIEWLFTQNNTKLLVYEHSDKTPEEEFTEDILAILQVFACRWNGKRKYSDKCNKEQENQDIPNPVAEEAFKEMVRCL